MVTRPNATMSPPMMPTPIRYGWSMDRRAAIRLRHLVSLIRSRRLRNSSAS